jgi:hypothetical protein
LDIGLSHVSNRLVRAALYDAAVAVIASSEIGAAVVSTGVPGKER